MEQITLSGDSRMLGLVEGYRTHTRGGLDVDFQAVGMIE